MSDQERKTRLLWLALPLAAFILLAGLVGHLPAGQALGPLAVDLTKTAAPARLLPGQPVTYTVTFVNSGELTTTLTVISDTLDPSLTFVDMLPGSDITTTPAHAGDTLIWTGPFTLPASAGLVLRYQVDTSTEPGWHWPCNEVTALSSDGPVGPARACVEVGPEKAFAYLPLVLRNVYHWAEYTIAKSVTPDTVADTAGEVVTYTVTIANIGNIPGKLAAVVDTLPAGFTYLDMAPGSDVTADPTGATGAIRWGGPFAIAAGGQLRLIYKVSPSQTPGQYTNSANVEVVYGKPPAGPASALVTVQSSVLLEEDFEGGMSRWTEFLNHRRLASGQWYWDATAGVGGSGAVVQDALAVPGEVASDALLMYLGEGAQEWTNYRAEMKMMLTGGVDGQGHILPETGDPIGFWVRGHYQDSDLEAQWVSGYYAVLVGASNRAVHHVRIAKMQQPGDCDACLKPYRMYNFNNPIQKAQSADLPGPFEHYRWYHLAVEVRDANIKVWVDGELVLDWTDPLLPYMSGTIGFKTHETKDAMFDDVIVTPLP